MVVPLFGEGLDLCNTGSVIGLDFCKKTGEGVDKGVLVWVWDGGCCSGKPLNPIGLGV